MTSPLLDYDPTRRSSRQASLAKTSPWRALVAAWVTAREAGSSGTSSDSWLTSAQHGSSSRTSLASCQRPAPAPETAPALQGALFDAPETSTPSPEEPARADASPPTAASWVPSSGRWENSGMASPGECWTLSTSEFPSAAAASSLSDVLETPGPHLLAYCLSPTAAVGILRRASRRGRTLPPTLHEALVSLASRQP